jgi:hypothetical protein
MKSNQLINDESSPITEQNYIHISLPTKMKSNQLINDESSPITEQNYIPLNSKNKT